MSHQSQQKPQQKQALNHAALDHPISPPLPALPPPSPAPAKSTTTPQNGINNHIGIGHPTTSAVSRDAGTNDSRHARRPSRAERYEAVVESARTLLQRHQECTATPRGARQGQVISHASAHPRGEIGLGIDRQSPANTGAYIATRSVSTPLAAASTSRPNHSRGKSHGDSDYGITVEEWRNTIQSLLTVVDGMVSSWTGLKASRIHTKLTIIASSTGTSVGNAR